MQQGNRKGLLVVVEGIDGAGKSTAVRALADHCRAHHIEHVVSREPTTGKWGMMLRASAKAGRLSLEKELELFMEDRGEHVLTLIAPALGAGKVVILDRYYFSTAAYQGARGADPKQILADHASFAPEPDLVLLLDLDPAAGRARIHQRGDQPDGFEDITYLSEVRQIFLSIEKPFIRRIDAAQSAESVCAEVIRSFDELLIRHAARP